jgi:hypothetical protein
MTDLSAMWSALASHQFIADKKGYGKEWAKMCKKRTVEAANAADAAAEAAGSRASYAAAYAADAVAYSASAYADAANAAYVALATSSAIKCITKANK